MKNFKNTVAAMMITVILGVSTIFADPGIMISDRTIPTTPEPCPVKNEGPDNGIMISDVTGGIIIYGLTGGIIIYGRTTPAEATCKG